MPYLLTESQIGPVVFQFVSQILQGGYHTKLAIQFVRLNPKKKGFKKECDYYYP
jgi:hypothetical protein